MSYHWVTVQVAAALALGAAGVVMDMHLEATKETMLSPMEKHHDQSADMKQTRLFDDLGAKDLPAGVDRLVIDNRSSVMHGNAALAEVSQT